MIMFVGENVHRQYVLSAAVRKLGTGANPDGRP